MASKRTNITTDEKISKIERDKRAKKRKADIEELDKTHDYYSIRNLVNSDAHICIAIGQRSNGKTWSSLDYVLDKYNSKKYTFVYVRRWAEDITARTMNELFSKSDLKKYFGDEAVIKYRSGEFMLYRHPDDDPEIIGFTAALNQVAHTKGRNFPNARTIIFDEFLKMYTEQSLKGEIDAWEQTISTIFRVEPNKTLMSDRKIIMLGNTVTKYSPYFKHYGINARDLTQGEIYSNDLINKRNGKITKIKCEYCKYNPRVGEETSIFVVGSNMASTGEFEIQPVSDIPQTDGEEYHDSLLMSMFDPEMEVLVGVFLRRSTWYTFDPNIGPMFPKAHHREFLVVRPSAFESSYYHLTNVKDLTYGSWNDLNVMLNDIKENTDIDVRSELVHGRLFCQDEYIAENFVECWKMYSSMQIDKMI